MTDTPQPAADVRSIGIQCNLLAVPPLKKLKCKDDIIEDITEESEVEETDVDHLYWCAASSPEGDGNEMAVRWKSLMEHICDRHNECYHLPLGVEERRKKWFQPGILVLSVYIYVHACMHAFT